MLNNLNQNFTNIEVIKIFYYIGLLSSFNSNLDKYKLKSAEIDKNLTFYKTLFPIVNDSGIFSLNTWLYAFFEGIDLVGFTSREAMFDNFVSCSLDMFDHDIYHIKKSISIEKYSDKFYLFKRIYYNILNSEHFATTKKELFILILWIIIHEDVKIDNFDEPLEYLIKELLIWSYEDPAGNSIIVEFKKYSSVILNNSNIEYSIYHYKYYNHMYNNIYSKFDNKKLSKSCSDFDNFVNLKNIDTYNDYNYFFLSAIYIIKDIKDNYNYYISPINE